MVENGFFPVITERDIADNQWGSGLVEDGAASFRLDRFSEKVFQAADAGNRRLNVLDFHADAL